MPTVNNVAEQQSLYAAAGGGTVANPTPERAAGTSSTALTPLFAAFARSRYGCF
jgi:hypothetical protein